MTDNQQLQRGIDALQVLENIAFREAFSMLNYAVVDEWKKCPVRDQDGQMLLLQLAKTAAKFEAILIGMVENGKLAKHRIDLDSLRNESKPRAMWRKAVNG